MNRLYLLALVALASACTRTAPEAPSPPLEVVDPPAEPPIAQPAVTLPPAPAPAVAPVAKDDLWAWELAQPAADGELSQKPTQPAGTCDLAWFSNRTQQQVWTSNHCLGTKEDLFFVAPDGRRVITLHPTVAGARWQEMPVVEVSNKGELAKTITAQLAFTGTGLEPLGGKLVWLHGIGDLPGPKPALTPDGDAVAFTRIDGQMMKVDFEGRLFRVDIVHAPAPRPAVVAAPSPAEPTREPAKPLPVPTGAPQDDQAARMKRIVAEQNCKQYGICNNTSSMGQDSPDNLVDNSRNSSVIGHDENQIPKRPLIKR